MTSVSRFTGPQFWVLRIPSNGLQNVGVLFYYMISWFSILSTKFENLNFIKDNVIMMGATWSWRLQYQKTQIEIPEPIPKEANPPTVCQLATDKYQNPNKKQVVQVPQTVKWRKNISAKNAITTWQRAKIAFCSISLFNQSISLLSFGSCHTKKMSIYELRTSIHTNA